MRRKLCKTQFALSLTLMFLGCSHLRVQPREPGPLVETCILRTKPSEDTFEITVGKSDVGPKPRAVCRPKSETTEVRTLQSVHKYVCMPPGDLEALILWGNRE